MSRGIKALTNFFFVTALSFFNIPWRGLGVGVSVKKVINHHDHVESWVTNRKKKKKKKRPQKKYFLQSRTLFEPKIIIVAHAMPHSRDKERNRRRATTETVQWFSIFSWNWERTGLSENIEHCCCFFGFSLLLSSYWRLHTHTHTKGILQKERASTSIIMRDNQDFGEERKVKPSCDCINNSGCFCKTCSTKKFLLTRSHHPGRREQKERESGGVQEEHMLPQNQKLGTTRERDRVRVGVLHRGRSSVVPTLLSSFL